MEADLKLVKDSTKIASNSISKPQSNHNNLVLVLLSQLSQKRKHPQE
jgi:hypothetical protein